jgi:hypothetical protein
MTSPPAGQERYIGVALAGHVRMLRRHGYEPPPWLEPYIDRLMAPDADMLTRRRYLNRLYKRRSRARQKAKRAA